MRELYGFVVGMWALIMAGGGIVVTVLGPISVTGYGQFDAALSSGIKAAVSIILVIVWILILTKMKHWIFDRALSR